MAKKPKVKFSVMSEKDNYKAITMFFDDDKDLDARFTQNLAKRFNIDVEYLRGKSYEDRLNYITSCTFPIYQSKINLLQYNLNTFQNMWNKNERKILLEFEKIFNEKLTEPIIAEGRININPICPRFYDTWSFDIWCESSPTDALVTAIHEITHFLWFDKWKEVFPNWKRSDFERPSISWLFSEIAIDAIFYHSCFKEFSGDKPAYYYFYDVEIEGTNMIKLFRKLYKENSIENFMKLGMTILNRNLDVVLPLTR